MKQIWYRKTRMVLMASVLFLLASCIDGFHDDETFSSGVTNTQLVSPDGNLIKISSQVNAQNEDEFKIQWPVVYGAGGYRFTLYIVDDPSNPQPVGVEDEIIDGCTVIRPQQEDTKYKIKITALGSEKYKNTEALSATEFSFSTLVPRVLTIPNNTELSSWFAAHPITPSASEQAYELEPNGTYTLDGELDFGLNWITFRGDKVHHPKIIYGENGRIITQSGLKLKFIDFDCSNVSSASANGSLLLLNSNPDASIIRAASDVSSFPALIDKDIVIKSCNIMGINKYLFYSNNAAKGYTVKNFRLQNCIIASNSTTNVIALPQGYVNDLSLIQNTIYSLVNSSAQFISYNNSGRPSRGGYVSGTIALYNNTLYNITNSGNIANYPGMSNTTVTVKLRQNLFVDCSNRNVVRRLCPNGNTTCPREFSKNAYWWNPDGFAVGDEMDGSAGDKSGTGFYENPNFVGPINNPDPTKVNFKPTGTSILSKQVGDPRWLSAQ